jgi:hypothetical protein
MLRETHIRSRNFANCLMQTRIALTETERWFEVEWLANWEFGAVCCSLTVS